MDKPTLALLIVFGVHLAAIPVLVWLLLDGDRFDWRSWWPRDDRGEDGPGPGPQGGPPLGDGRPADRRLRDAHDRLTAPARHRRPAHAPQREREPAAR